MLYYRIRLTDTTVLAVSAVALISPLLVAVEYRKQIY